MTNYNIMSRKHFKICLSCKNFILVKDKSYGGFYRHEFFGGFFNGEPMCAYNLAPKNNSGNETCIRYKSKNKRRNK